MSVIHNVLAEIPSRYAFLQKVQSLIDQNEQVSLFIIDVVRFSDVSTSFGYKAGDYILSEIVRRIQSIFAFDAEVGRVSGDVFGLVFPGQHRTTQLNSFYTRLNEHFKSPIHIGDHAFIADFNVGAVSNPDENRDVNKLFSGAETALKQAKGNKYDNFAIVSLTQKKHTGGRALALKADLKRAFANDELELYFQPKIDLKTLKIIGAECLLRWHHPLDGVLFPGALIDAAESYNMMNELGYWALRKAFDSLLYFQAAGFDINLAVNVSPTQLYDDKFVHRLKQYSENMCIDLSRIELELTEDAAMSNSLMVNQQLAAAKRLGAKIAIDDFGKGYSNLAYIRDLDIDTIKIDKTFIMQLLENPVNKAIVEATKVIADSLSCNVVAEGIEELQHLHILRELGIGSGQGYLFSQAVPMQDFIALLHTDISVGGSYAFTERA
ncbi:putative bifunctional diguanylate cyclase/phosphodiesterase [Planctobacterium marinum]|uniref:putative bifunctional diguanylate cyclase/phosphodiesterase n=1 Tax=Planctobacterium marinum TaxID=1631968 RepID=UPI001E5A1F1E|nr:bifunctional diguanylate cyclase/phosphodiesterase [Planctobacterium marinum]MCC2604290.1 bifunctional diguanylate cyclase/phosphodiesterase [Planctobacterium marinum]